MFNDYIPYFHNGHYLALRITTADSDNVLVCYVNTKTCIHVFCSALAENNKKNSHDVYKIIHRDLRDPTCSDESCRRSLKTFLFAKY